MPGFGVLRGLEGMAQLWRRWIEEWEHYSWTHSNWAEIDNHIVVDNQVKATGRLSGADVISTRCEVFTFSGQGDRWSLFDDRASALAAIESL